MDPAKFQNISQLALLNESNNMNRMMPNAVTIHKNDTTVPNFLGKTLKISIQEAKLAGIFIEPFGTSGKVVWQSVSPGKLINNDVVCKIKLESM